MKNNLIISIIIATITFYSCNSKSQKNNHVNNTAQTSEEELNDNSSGCNFEDGIYSATVDYNNPETGYAATYTLDVEIQDCQVVKIIFPNDGYLDEDHISYADIDEEGNASVDGEEGKTYEIQIDE